MQPAINALATVLSPHQIIRSDLLDVLGWTTRRPLPASTSKPAEVNDTELLLLGHEVAATVTVVPPGSLEDCLPLAAAFNYHAGFPWGLLISGPEIAVFNSTWSKGNKFYSLPSVSHATMNQNGEIIRRFCPEDFLGDNYEGFAFTFRPPDRILQPVDEELVDRLDHWRTEAFRHSPHAHNTDSILQQLFVQLFILRNIEDRLLVELPPLTSALEHGLPKIEALDVIFNLAVQHVQAQLFESRPFKELPPHVVAGVINDLYEPPHGKAMGLRYNFSWLDPSVLGHAYEKYLSVVLIDAGKPDQGSLFEPDERRVERVSVRKTSGVYYTPPEICRFLTDRALDSIWSDTDPDYIPVIADISCGGGGFLGAALDSLLERLKARNPEKNWSAEIIAKKAVRGADIDPLAVSLATQRLYLRLASEPGALPMPDLNGAVQCVDSLSPAIEDAVGSGLDVVVGNPPFLSVGMIHSRTSLVNRFESARGRFDYSSLFVEQGIKLLRHGGSYGQVVPNRLVNNRDAAAIRSYVSRNSRIHVIVDFNATPVFGKVMAYVALLVGTKQVDDGLQTVSVIEVKRESTSFLAARLELAADNAPATDDTIEKYEIKISPGDDNPWALISSAGASLRVRMQEYPVLGEFGEVVQGIKTGANDLFICRIERESGDLVEAVNGLGSRFVIERALLHPVVFGSEIKPYIELLASKSLIYPYANGQPLREHQLRAEYPRTWAYFESVKHLLENRGSLTPSLQWFELIRPRSETWLGRPKILMRDMAQRTSFARNTEGGIYVVGGTAIVPYDPVMVNPLLAYVNSRLANWYLSTTSSQFQGGYFRFDPGQLAELPIPEFILNDPGTLDAIDKIINKPIDDSTRDELDKVIFDVTGIQLSEIT